MNSIKGGFMEENMDKSVPDSSEFSPSQRDLFSQEEENDVQQQEQTLFQDMTVQQQTGAAEESIQESDSIPNMVSPVKKQEERHITASEQATVGQMLAQGRTQASLELRDVAEITRIRLEYLKALEEDNRSGLPVSKVFIQSYIRTCMEIYHLDQESRARIMEKFKEEEEKTAEEVPEKILEHIGREGQISQEEAQRVRLICIYGAIILFLLLSLTVTSIVAVSLRNSRNKKEVLQEQQVKSFDRKNLEKLLGPQIPDPIMLEMPKEKR